MQAPKKAFINARRLLNAPNLPEVFEAVKVRELHGGLEEAEGPLKDAEVFAFAFARICAWSSLSFMAAS